MVVFRLKLLVINIYSASDGVNMEIKKLVLSNFCLHKDLELNFNKGTVGVIGGNGSGKSTIFEAISFAITGKLRHLVAQLDIVSWGAETGSVTIDFVQKGQLYSIQRCFGVKGAGRHKMILPDGTRLVKANEIEETITDLLGTTTDSLLNNIFIAQGRIDEILFCSPKMRACEIYQSIGLDRLHTAYTQLCSEMGKYIITAGLPEKVQQEADLITELTAQLTTVRNDLSLVEDELTQILPLADKYNRLVAARAQSVLLQAAQVRLTAKKEQLQAAQTCENTYCEDLKTVKSLCSLDEEKVDIARKILQADETARAIRQNCVASILKVENRLAGIQIGDLDKLRQRRDELVVQRSQHATVQICPDTQLLRATKVQIEVEMRDLEQLKLGHLKAVVQHKELTELAIAAITPGSNCPACGQAVTDVDTFKENSLAGFTQFETQALSQCWLLDQKYEAKKQQVLQLNSEIVQKESEFNLRVVQQLKECEKSLLDVAALIRTEESNRTERDSLCTVRNQYESQLQQLPEPVETDAYRSLVTSYDVNVQKVGNLEMRIGVQRQTVERLECEVASLAADCRNLSELVEDVSDAELQRLKEEADKVSSRTLSQTRLQSQQSILEAQIGHHTSLFSSLKKQADTESNAASWVGFCQSARSVLHTNALPKLMAQEYIQRINNRMAEYLSIWEAPFTAVLTDELEFNAIFSDGRRHSALRLSGGQRIVAATCYRLCITELFAKEVGLLLLDEPSAYLDDDNVKLLQAVLTRLKVVAGNTGRQIMVVTHEKALSGFFDNVVQLYS